MEEKDCVTTASFLTSKNLGHTNLSFPIKQHIKSLQYHYTSSNMHVSLTFPAHETYSRSLAAFRF